jgi:uncharacterized protein DUF1524
MFTKSGRLRAVGTALAITAGAMVGLTGSAQAIPPGIPDAPTAQSELGQLTVAPDGSMDGYDRDKFPHWHDVDDACNTREAVLKRDGDNVEVGSDCYPTSGTWTSPYDGETWSAPADVDIDHMVPLADAWRTGAANWSQEQREAFANDLDSPQLWAVTDNVNQSKGDKPPDQWKPPLQSHWCEYSRAFIHVKFVYKLTVNDAEKAALEEMLGTC